jgi:hypothetical protein
MRIVSVDMDGNPVHMVCMFFDGAHSAALDAQECEQRANSAPPLIIPVFPYK